MTDTRSFRVGDAERDAAVSALGEHFAAGRITKDEFDERSGRAWSARFGAELDELFADLPQPVAVRADPWPAQRRAAPRRVLPLLLMVPLVVMAVGGLLFLIVSTAPWLLFVLFMLFLFGGPGHRRRHWQGHGGARPGWGPPSRGDWPSGRRDWPPARPGWGPQPRNGWASGRS